ncbi:MAG: STAS domain-containing protein [Thermodesulfobacteriota bacterium]|nr:STAS domain-containing protein [Thermodesulfobacteriota bacterium]
MAGMKKTTQNNVVKPGKELTASKGDGITKKLQKKMHGGITQMTMDLSAVKKMDTIGLGLIMAAHNALKEAGGNLNLINVPHELSAVFEAMGLAPHIEWEVIA